MWANDLLQSTFGAVPPGDAEALAAVVSGAVRKGFGIVLLKPEQKVPICILTAKQMKDADTEAQDAARLIGDDHWQKRRHACGLAHVLTVESLGGDPSKVRAKVSAILGRMAKKYGGTPNIGVVPSACTPRYLILDADTDAEVTAMEQDWEGSFPGLTVRSPGVVTSEGEWVHKNGGHIWLKVPDGIELPKDQGVWKSPSGYTAMWANAQVLVPPSARAEGAYIIVGQISDAPSWLIEILQKASHDRMKRAESVKMADGSSDIDVWSANTPWGDILEPDGWISTNMPDRCGCPTWTAPGGHASPKSATAHEAGCDRFDVDPGHAPMHVWTDSPPDWLAHAVRQTGGKTFTRLQYVAWRDYGGDLPKALMGMGFNHKPVGGDLGSLDSLLGSRPVAVAVVPEPAPEPVPDRPESGAELLGVPGAGTSAADGEPAPESGTQSLPGASASAGDLFPVYDSNDLGQIPPIQPLIEDVLEVGTIAMIAGMFGTYKTFVALDWAGHLATGKPWNGHAVPEAVPVVYVAAEGARGIQKRLAAWKTSHGPINRGMLTVVAQAVKINDNEHMLALIGIMDQLGAKLLIFDTLHRSAPGVEENSAKEMGSIIDRLSALQRRTDATVLLIHHTGHDGKRARGSSVNEDNIDTSFVIRLEGDGEDRAMSNKRTMIHRKSKDGELLGPISIGLKLVDGTGSGYVVTDPWEGGNGPKDDKEEERMAETKLSILKFLEIQDEPITKQAVEKGVGGNAQRVREALTELVSGGLVLAVPRTGRGPKTDVYSLPGSSNVV